MESGDKRRSGSFESQKATQTSSDEAQKLSLSEGSIVDKDSNVSPESSEAGTLKKPRKFKPRKFLAKRFKLKKSEKSNDEPEQESGQSEQENSKKSVATKLSEKLSSPKLQRFNFVKRFSGTKSYKVSPMSGSMDEGMDNVKSNEIKLLSSLSAGELTEKNPETKDDDDGVTFEEQESFVQQVSVPTNVISTPTYTTTSSKESVTMESKKVELKITISGKKRSVPSPNASERAIDKASPLTQSPNEPSTRTDILLPSTSTQVRLSTSRDQFFNTKIPFSGEANVGQNIKPINNEIANLPVTFAGVVKDGLSVKSVTSKESTEVEKYLILTSSLNTIISAAKELDDLGSITDTLKFPQNIPELKIREEKLESKEENSTKVKLETVQEQISTEKFSDALASSTPLKAEAEDSSEDIESDEMKKQGKKSKIPVDRRRASGSIDSIDKEQIQTVRTQETHKPYHLNLSTSSSEESKGSPSSTVELKAEEIKFELGTPVRPQRTSPASTTIHLAPLALSDTPSFDKTIEVEDSIDESFHSPKSEKSFLSESTRRRIAYVPQLTIYTTEEQELLKSNIQANADSFDLSSLPTDSSIFPNFDDSVANTMTSSPNDKREHLYKILVIGELGTGKTSFIKRYVHQFFSQNYRATIGVDFALKVLNWDQSTVIRLQLWDIAGQERFGNMTRVYYKEAVGAFIVFDVTRSATFDAVLKWKQDLDSKVSLPDGSQIPCILLANKCDQQKQGLVTMPAKMDEYCKQHGFSGWFETSAKDNVNIEESAKSLVSKILINDKLIHNDIDGGTIVLNGAEDADGQNKKFCSC